LALPPGRLSSTAIQLLNHPDHSFCMSDASVWEICLKHGAGKLPLPGSPRKWLPTRLTFFQVTTLPLNHQAMYLSGELPRVHADPFDRLLAAHAMEEGLTILSPDASLSILGAARLW
jgi:PIN domain nuclease of toxin-antitoxin system